MIYHIYFVLKICFFYFLFPGASGASGNEGSYCTYDGQQCDECHSYGGCVEQECNCMNYQYCTNPYQSNSECAYKKQSGRSCLENRECRSNVCQVNDGQGECLSGD